MLRFRSALTALSVVGLVTAGCATTASPSASASAGGTNIDVTLQEFAVLPSTPSASAGEVTFHVTNNGPDDVHEFVIVKTDLAPDALPTTEDGSVDEAGEGIEPVDEIEDIAVGASEDLTVTLEAGNYVLLCNIVEAGEVHYESGMRTAFSVE